MMGWARAGRTATVHRRPSAHPRTHQRADELKLIEPAARANHPYKTFGAASARASLAHPTSSVRSSPAAEERTRAKQTREERARSRRRQEQEGSVDGQLPGGGGGGGADPAPRRRPHGARLLGALGGLRHGGQPGPLRRRRHRHHAAGRWGRRRLGVRARDREAPQAAPPRRHPPARPRLSPRQLRRGAEGVRVEAARQAEPRHGQGQGRRGGGTEAGGQAPPPPAWHRRQSRRRRRRAHAGVRPVTRQGHAPGGGEAGAHRPVVLRCQRHQTRTPRRRRGGGGRPRRGAGGGAAARAPLCPAMEARAAEHCRRLIGQGLLFSAWFVRSRPGRPVGR